ncbi:anthocyanidin O-glucosyltransferase [Salix suchowensis]|nr:anthocyanidin O-glucosyltransferase [Salix suchowensis]
MKKAEVVLIPIPAMGHIVAIVEIAKLLLQRDDRLYTTILVMHPTLDPSTTKYNESLAASALPDRMRVINLPRVESITSDTKSSNWLSTLIEGQKPHVKEYVSKMRTQFELSLDAPRLAGFIFDSFATGLKEVANEFGFPWYAFSASGAAFLGCLLHLQALHDEQGVDLTEFKNSDVELKIPSLANPLPAQLLPSALLEKDSLPTVLEQVRALAEARGILVNTFIEFESHAVTSLSNGRTPPIYPVGPIIRQKRDGHDVGSEQSNDYRNMVEWLDDQPPSSVMFLCFGSNGSFREKQVTEIACALENSGHRFLWSLRKPPPAGKWEPPRDYADFQEILPKEFLNRTAKIGKVIGWAPQVDILAHQAIGMFASHCGWNSILESIRFGVPIVAWPLYAEQQFNAFQMVIELGLAVEIKMDYRKNFHGDNEIIVSADDIMKAIKHVMEGGEEIRKKVKELSGISEKSVMADGRSYSSLGRLVDDIIDNHQRSNSSNYAPTSYFK